MGQVVVDEKVKAKLEKYKDEKGCKTLSDAINLLLFEHKVLKDKYNFNFNNI